MSTPTPSKLAILRAAGQVQREIAADQNTTGQQVVADVHHPANPSNVTTRRRQDPLEQISVAQDELSQVQSDLQAEQQLLQRLRGTHLTDGETEFEDAQDGEDVDGDDDPQDTAGRSAHFGLPEDSPFSQEWFARVVGAAIAAAASSSSSAPPSRSTKLKITDRKLPDFWEWQPVAWFRLFDRHVKPFKPSQAETFDALLPLLSTEACKHVQPIVRSPGLDPYTRARSSLIRHFDKTPRDQARECRRLESLGDMMPSDMLEHIYGLLPDPAVIYEVIFLDLLPPAARDAALQHTSLSAMASAADKIVREGSSTATNVPTVSAVSTSIEDSYVDGDVAALADRRPPRSGARPRQDPRRRSGPRQRSPRPQSFLCSNHIRWGKNTHRCSDPASCHMKDITRPRPEVQPAARPSGNGWAGGQ